MVWAVIVSLALWSTPALANEGIEVISEPEMVEIDHNLDDEGVRNATNENGNATEKSNEDDAEKVLEQGKNEVDEEPNKELGKESGLLESNSDTSGIEESAALAVGDRASVRLVAYSNMSPSSSYALYAEGLLKEVKQDESYCLVQDSNASYVFVVGKADSLSTFSDARWWRWYSTTGYGWRLERGSGSVSVDAGQYQVISNLQGYPSLVTEVQETTRREVMFYALVAASVFSLSSVWMFSVRMSSNSNGRFA